MTCRRVFAHNNDLSYNNYYDKFRKKNKRIQNITINSNFERIRVPINAIDGPISCYINEKEFFVSNCIECINSIDLCDVNVCNNPQVLYPHGIYIVRNYNRCNNYRCNNFLCKYKNVNPNTNSNLDNLYTSLINDLNKYYKNDTINSRTITKLNNSIVIPPANEVVDYNDQCH
jgi:hypothetical protein